MKTHKQPRITLGIIIGISFAFTLIAFLAVGNKVIFGNPDTPRLLNYQGKLTDANGPVTGTVSITFSIYDIPTGGSPLWTEPHGNVTVTDGLFNVILGGINPIPDSVLNGGERYFELTVNGEPITPRQQIVSVLFTVKAQDAETLEGHSASDFAAIGHTHSDYVDLTSAQTITGTKTFNYATVSSWLDVGSSGGINCLGTLNVGSSSQSSSVNIYTGGYGLIFYKVGGLRFGDIQTNDNNDMILRAPSGLLRTQGDLYLRYSTTSTWRDLYCGEVQCYDYLNIYNQANETQRAARIYGNGTNLEIYTENPDDKVIINGPLRITTRTGEGYGEISFGTKDSGHVFLRETDNRDLEIEVPSGRTVKVLGNLTATGSKPALVTTHSYGKRYVYSEEAAEIYFFDRNGGKLINGQATIHLDPIFLETVTIDADHPMRVQITPTADCKGIYVAEKTATSFKVKELMGGASNATFDWEVAAKRRGYENVRLKEASQKVTRRK